MKGLKKVRNYRSVSGLPKTEPPIAHNALLLDDDGDCIEIEGLLV